MRSIVAGLLAFFIAFGNVFHERFGKILAFTRSMEAGNHLLRELQSGRPGDYVA